MCAIYLRTLWRESPTQCNYGIVSLGGGAVGGANYHAATVGQVGIHPTNYSDLIHKGDRNQVLHVDWIHGLQTVKAALEDMYLFLNCGIRESLCAALFLHYENPCT